MLPPWMELLGGRATGVCLHWHSNSFTTVPQTPTSPLHIYLCMPSSPTESPGARLCSPWPVHTCASPHLHPGLRTPALACMGFHSSLRLSPNPSLHLWCPSGPKNSAAEARHGNGAHVCTRPLFSSFNPGHTVLKWPRRRRRTAGMRKSRRSHWQPNPLPPSCVCGPHSGCC